MTCYKLVSFEFKWFGLQNIMERKGIDVRNVFFKFVVVAVMLVLVFCRNWAKVDLRV